MDRDKILYLALWWWNLAGNPVITEGFVDEIQAVGEYVKKVRAILENPKIWNYM